MRIHSFTGGPFGENCYLAVCAATGAAVAVDPGAAAEELVRVAVSEGVELSAILLTHAHLDHVEGIPVVRAAFPEVPIYLHPDDLALYRAAPEQAAHFGMTVPSLPEPDCQWADGDTFVFGDRTWEVKHTPGHAPGHVILVDRSAGVALVGDVIFHGSIGRTDLPGGDYGELMRSIRETVLALPEETRMLSGHGPETTVGLERRGNPFLIPNYGGELV